MQVKTINPTKQLFKACEHGHFLKAMQVCEDAKENNQKIKLFNVHSKYFDLNPLALTIASSLQKHINKRSRFIRFLLSHSEMDIHQTFKENFSYLQIAILFEDLDTIKLLLQFPGLNINHQDNCGLTALHWAFLLKKIEIIYLLLQKLPDMNVKDKSNKSPMDYSSWLTKPQCLALVRTYCTAVVVCENEHRNVNNHFFNGLPIRQENIADYASCNRKSV